MSTPVSNSTTPAPTIPSVPPVPKWTKEQDNLVAALKVLSEIQPNNKLMVNTSTQIAIENRWAECIRRYFSGDSCKATAAAIDTITRKSLSFTSLAKIYLEKKTQQTENPLNEEDLKLQEKTQEMKQLLVGAMGGIKHLSNLYGSPKEGELKISEELDERINGSFQSNIFDAKDKELLPQPQTPVDSNQEAFSATNFIIENAGNISSVGHTVIAAVGFATAATKLTCDVISITSSNGKLPMKVLSAILSFINISGAKFGTS